MSKLTLHVQSMLGYLAPFVADSGVQWIKIIDPPEQDPFPGVRVVGRTYIEDGTSNGWIWQGAAGAETWFNHWQGYYAARPWVWAWEGPNEPQPMADASFRVALDAFTAHLAELMTNAGLRLVGHNWAVGWPDIGHAPGFAASMTALANGQHYLGLHQYSAPSMLDSPTYYTLRHRRTFAELRAAGIAVPHTLITECGIDGGVLGQQYARTGWRTWAQTESAYMQQLEWFSGEIGQDPEVEAAFIFTVCDFDWFDFHVNETLANMLAQFIAQDEEEPPVIPELPAGAEGIDVSQWQGNIDWQAVADSGIEFAFIRASVCRSDGTVVKDPYFDQNWAGAKAAGILRGAYHYLRGGVGGQALFFVQSVGGDLPELGYWGDFEDASLDKNKCRAFLGAVDARALELYGWSGDPCGVYSRASFLDPWGDLDWAAGRKLWVAHWFADEPTLPDAWDEWEFWQYANDGAVPGIVGNVDLDRYKGGSEPAGVRYFDHDGDERDAAWWTGLYGDGAAIVPGPGGLHIVELHDSGPEAGMDFQVYGVPQSVTPVLHDGGDVPLEWKADGYWEGLVFNPCYAPPSVGAYTLTVPDGDTLADFGWLCETNHRHPQRIVYAEGGPPVEEHTLTVTVEGQGSVARDTPGPYPDGAVVSLLAVPAGGWAFAGWSGDVTGLDNPASLTMDADKAVTATFLESADPVAALIEEARALIAQADGKLVEALGLLP